MASIWDLYAKIYDTLPKHFRPYQELVKEVVGEVKNCLTTGRVLDAGCGTGNYSIAIADVGYEVIGVDFSESMLSRAEGKKRSTNADKVQFLKLDLISKLPYPDNYFDCVISINSMYTITETGPVLDEYYRVLRPEGAFILSELQRPISIIPCLKEAKHTGGWREVVSVFCHLFLIGIFNFIVVERQITGFYHYWNEKELREKLSKAGFGIISVREAYTTNVDLFVISKKPVPLA